MEEIELFRIRVGEKFPLFPQSTEKFKTIGDGAIFEASDFNQGYMFCIYNMDLQFMEIQTYRNEKIHTRIIQDNDGMVLPMIKFGKTNVIFEMVFDPTKYDDNRALQFTEINNMLMIYVIESRNGVLKYARQCNLPLKFIQICKEAWGRAILDLDFTQKYDDWIAKMSRYDLVTLWKRGTDTGIMGESYDLNDIKTPFQYKPQDI